MRKRIVLLGAALTMVMSIAACGGKTTTDRTDEEPVKMIEDDDLDVSSKTDSVGSDGVLEELDAVSVQMLTEEEYEAKKAEGVQLAESGETEYVAHILVTFNQDVTAFTLWRLSAEFQDEDEEPVIEGLTALAELEEIKANESVIVTTSLGEILPTAGFTYVDADGIMRRCYLGESGMDGSAYYEEYSAAPTDN